MTSNPSGFSKDFFISYTKDDEKWAEWIAWQLEELGHTTVIQAWDFEPGSNFVLEMQKASTEAKRTIAVLSPEYFASDFTESEWAAAFADDPKGEKGRLLLIKVKPVDVTGLLKSVTAIDLTGLSVEESKKRLETKINASEDGKRNKPTIEPSFPGIQFESKPIQTTQDRTQNTTQLISSVNRNKFEESHEFKAGLVDKDAQAKHVFKSTGNEFYGNDANRISQSAFLLTGAGSQWPYALIYILYYEIKKRHQFNNQNNSIQSSPEPVFINGRVLKGNISPESYLWELIAEKLTCSPQRKIIESNLGSKTAPNILFRPLKGNESQNPELIHGMLEAWEKLKFPQRTPHHILILFYENSVKPRSMWLSLIKLCLPWVKKNELLIDKIKQNLLSETKSSSKTDIETWIDSHFLPQITSPNKQNIKDWVDFYFDPGKTQKVKDYVVAKINAEYQKRKNDKQISKESADRIKINGNDIEIHHDDLKYILIEALIKFG